MKKVSIIIVTYNSEKDIYDCITSIIENPTFRWRK